MTLAIFRYKVFLKHPVSILYFTFLEMVIFDFFLSKIGHQLAFIICAQISVKKQPFKFEHS